MFLGPPKLGTAVESAALMTSYNLQCMLHKMTRANTPSCRRYDAEKETLVYILCECSVLEKRSMQTLGFARMDLNKIRGESEQCRGPLNGSL